MIQLLCFKTSQHGQVQEMADSRSLNSLYHFHWQRLMKAKVVLAGGRVVPHSQVSRWRSVQNYTQGYSKAQEGEASLHCQVLQRRRIYGSFESLG